MKLLIKQRVFSWSDTYDIYDENENEKYFVTADIIALGHRLHVFDKAHREIGMVKQQSLLRLFPAFNIEVNGIKKGWVKKKLSFIGPKYEVNLNGWHVEGDCFGWNYDVYSGNNLVIHISRDVPHWGDAYMIDFTNPADELMGLLLVIAIDAANCMNGN